jgi:hypothetical protein
MTAEDVPARHDRLAAAMNTHMADALKEAVKWVMEPEMLAMEAEIERRVRKQVAAEIEARGVDLRGDDENPLSREEWACYGDAASIARGEVR